MFFNILSLFCFLFFSFTTFCSSFVVGTVDLPSLLLLHPQMREFNFAALRFRRRRELPSGTSYLDAERQFQEAMEKLRVELTGLQFEEEKQRIELNRELSTLSNRLSGVSLQQEQLRRGREFREGFAERRAESYKNMEQWLTTEDETVDIFRRMHSEARVSLEELRRKYELSLIVPVHNRRALSSSEPALHRLNMRSPVFFRNEFDRFLSGRVYGWSGKQYLLELESYLANYDELANHILPWFPDSFIVAGAIDLTAEAIEKLWQKQDVDKLTKERIRSVWEFWHNKK